MFTHSITIIILVSSVRVYPLYLPLHIDVGVALELLY